MEFYFISNMINVFGDMAYIFDYPRSIIYPAVLILLLTAFSPKDIYDGFKLYRALERGDKLPPRLANFLVHPTSVEKYLDVKEKIEKFKYQVLRGESSQIILSSNDLNDLYLQGIPINKYSIDWRSISIGIPFFKYNNSFTIFEITSVISQREIKYINYARSDGIESCTDEIEFSMSDNQILVKSKMTEINGKEPMKFVQDIITSEPYEIRSSSFLENVLKCNFDFSINYLESNEHQLILSVMDKLTNVAVLNECLIIEAKVL